MIYRRPTLQTLVLTAVIATMGSALLAFARPVEMMVDGQRVETDVPPVTMLGHHAYVPLRSIASALGAQTLVDGNQIVVIRGNQSLRLRVGDVHARVNGMPLTLVHAPFRVRGRVMIALKAVARAFNVQASYSTRDARITVLTPGIGQAPATEPTPATQ